MQTLPPHFLQRRACPTSCIAAVRTCVHHLLDNLLTAIRRIRFFVMERRNTPSDVKQCHDFSSTFTSGDLRQHHFQRLQRRRRRVQLWPCTCLTFLRDPPRAHVGLPWLSLISLRPSCLDGRLLRLTSLLELWCATCGDECTPPPHIWPWRTAPGQATRPCCHPDATLPTS